jgi:PleD family two-component response regulator
MFLRATEQIPPHVTGAFADSFNEVSSMMIDDENVTCTSADPSSRVGDRAVEAKTAESSEELSSFEHGFRVGRAEGMIALVDAMTQALGSGAELSQSAEATPKSSRLDADIANFFVARSRPSILIVDDEAMQIDLLLDTFDLEYEVLAATDGKTALETAERERPDLILLDVMMPDIDGYEVCRRLKGNRETQDIPVIFITALGGGEDEIRGLELGARDYLVKPVDPPSVKARVNSQVKLKYAQDKLLRLATLEQTLRENLLEALESKARLN